MIEPIYGIWCSDDGGARDDYWWQLDGRRVQFTSFAAAEKTAAELQAERGNQRFHYRAVVTNLDPLKHHVEVARAYEQWRHENKQEIPKP
jgi:hypothetical protein